jgi:hypothetical protein
MISIPLAAIEVSSAALPSIAPPCDVLIHTPQSSLLVALHLTPQWRPGSHKSLLIIPDPKIRWWILGVGSLWEDGLISYLIKKKKRACLISYNILKELG